MTDFKIATSNGAVASYGGDSRYMIDDDNGVLTVYTDDGKRLRYSPSGWLCVEDAPEPSQVYVM